MGFEFNLYDLEKTPKKILNLVKSKVKNISSSEIFTIKDVRIDKIYDHTEKKDILLILFLIENKDKIVFIEPDDLTNDFEIFKK